MRATVDWQGKACFSGRAGSGHRIVMDGPPEAGGENRGVRPMEMLLLGVGGCSSFDVVHILRKGRQEVSGCRVEVDAQRAESEPKVFTRIHLHFVVSGRKLQQVRVEKAVALSAEKYCSASIMLGRGGVEISHSFEIVETA
ncbi:MAG: OsmC family protein [Gammaproteobacteria bacterium]|nr:OsmC family protein [Gammaproteobacteria bacterium]